MTRDIGAFMQAHLPIRPVPDLPDIRLHQAGPQSGLHRIIDADAPPYWAHVWGGGLALARYVLDRGELHGRRVLDLGAGSGLVGIAAGMAGADAVLASDSDPDALSAVTVNATLNDVAITCLRGDLLDGPPPDVDLIAVGDLFYEARLARRATVFLDRCVQAGMEVLVGDPWRKPLPQDRLRLLADYPVRDFGDTGVRSAGVFAFTGAATP